MRNDQPPPPALRQAAAIQRASLASEVRMLSGAARGSWLYEADEVRAAVVPAAGDQPIANMVTYGSTTGLVERLDEIQDAYRSQRIRSWTLWVPEWDERARNAALRAGYRLAARLPAIVLNLDELKPRSLDGLDYAACDMATVGRINQHAHDGGDGLAAALAVEPPGVDARLYGARLDGAAAAVISAVDHVVGDDTDCGLYFGATLPEARGHGLGSGVVSAALRDAQWRGCATASGQASLMGAPVWARLGFRTLFTFETYVPGASDDR